MGNPIQLLDPLVAERIAAGEVIERPASVVKELVENALDAGATEIEVSLEEGGRVLIEVTDNGGGIPPEELALAVRRHATSKLRELSDLERLATLGFRGEALPSIAAVSELTLLSRARGAASAHEWRAPTVPTGEGRAPAVTFGHFLHSPHGTRVQARGLFSQLPARLKFLKTQAAEVSQVREWIERLALAHPEAGFKLLSDGRALVQLRPAKEAERVRAVLSDGDDYPLITADNSTYAGEVRVRVHWLQGLSSPQSRRIVQVVNGRAVRDRLLQQALMMPFRQALLPGQFPAVALYIELDPSLLDVNVHPTKTEIRFLRSRDIFHAVEGLVEGMIVKEGAPGIVASRTPWSASESMALPLAPAPSWSESPRTYSGSVTGSVSDTTPDSGTAAVSDAASLSVSASDTGTANGFLTGSRFAGFLFNTYMLYDLGHELALVDQHAAHERIRYERLRARISGGRAPQPQQLLIPETARFPAERRPELEQKLTRLHALGFEAELFGDDTVLFRAVPADWGTDSLRPRIKNLVDKLLESDTASLIDETIFEALASEACHGSVRAGDRLEPAEAAAIVRDLFACEHPWNCPHGRPTVVRVPRGRLEEWFQRRV
jgi:DNA mismatch repair protein MutL